MSDSRASAQARKPGLSAIGAEHARVLLAERRRVDAILSVRGDVGKQRYGEKEDSEEHSDDAAADAVPPLVDGINVGDKPLDRAGFGVLSYWHPCLKHAPSAYADASTISERFPVLLNRLPRKGL